LLGLSVAVLNGDDDSSLSLGAGMVPGTSPIGGNGNTVIAGHRDLAFRALRNIQGVTLSASNPWRAIGRPRHMRIAWSAHAS
jgi:hypothetical protein